MQAQVAARAALELHNEWLTRKNEAIKSNNESFSQGKTSLITLLSNLSIVAKLKDEVEMLKAQLGMALEDLSETNKDKLEMKR